MDKRVKMLLYVINKRGTEVTYETRTAYSNNFNAMITKHILKFWYKGIRKNKKTDENEEYTYVKVVPMKNLIYLIRYLVAVNSNQINAGDDYE